MAAVFDDRSWSGSFFRLASGALPAFVAQVRSWPLQRRRRLQALAFEVAAAEARERERIANGLHDDIGQVLALVKFKLGELAADADAASAGAIEELRTLLAQATEATRHATFELRSPVLQQFGLQAALEGLAQRMNRLCGMDVVLRGQLPAQPLPGAAQAVVFRVVRELLLNVHKHARAQCVVVSMAVDGAQLRVEVADDGVGFRRPAGAWRFSAEGGYGMHSAEAQVEAVGGRLTVRSKPGEGTRAQLRLPLDRPDGVPQRSRSSSLSPRPVPGGW